MSSDSFASLTQSCRSLEVVLTRTSFGEFVRRVHELDLTLSQLAAMAALEGPAAGRTVTDVAEWIGLSAAATSALVERLRARNLVTREEAAEDRRVKCVSLTAEGREALELIAATREEALEAVLAKLSTDVRDDFIRMMARVAAELERAGHDDDSPDSS